MRRNRTAALGGSLLGLLLLTTGCASMPSTGSVENVTESPPADGGSQVRVIGVKPQKNDDARSLVRGFLEATTSDEAHYDTARLYLSERERKHWNPNAGITILTGSPSLSYAHSHEPERDGTMEIDLTGQEVGRVDGKHAYKPAGGRHRSSFYLSKDRNGQWRIDGLDNGLVLSQADFLRIYSSVNKYYFAASAGRFAASADRDVLIPDPVYLRRRVDSLHDAVAALLDGPTDWLSPAVGSRFPANAALDGQDAVGTKDSDTVWVRLRRVPHGQAQCKGMAAQLLRTVQTVPDQSSAKVKKAEIEGRDGSTACSISDSDAAAFDPLHPFGAAGQQYFVDAKGRLVRLSEDGNTQVEPVAGAFGREGAGLDSVAVRLDGEAAAGVREGGRALYVADLDSGAEFGRPVLTSKATKPDEGLTAPSFDGAGDLWVADRNPSDARLLVLRGKQQIQADVPDLGSGRITALRVAPDGTRIALLVRKGSRTTLQLGRVEHSGTRSDPQVSVRDLRPAAPQLEDVEAVSWAGQSRLMVVGRQSEGVRQLQYVDTDGSVPYSPTLPAISGVTAVAASIDQTRPVLADSTEGIYQLPPEANWTRVATSGSSPVYPG